MVDDARCYVTISNAFFFLIFFLPVTLMKSLDRDRDHVFFKLIKKKKS